MIYSKVAGDDRSLALAPRPLDRLIAFLNHEVQVFLSDGTRLHGCLHEVNPFGRTLCLSSASTSSSPMTVYDCITIREERVSAVKPRLPSTPPRKPCPALDADTPLKQSQDHICSTSSSPAPGGPKRMHSTAEKGKLVKVRWRRGWLRFGDLQLDRGLCRHGLPDARGRRSLLPTHKRVMWWARESHARGFVSATEEYRSLYREGVSFWTTSRRAGERALQWEETVWPVGSHLADAQALKELVVAHFDPTVFTEGRIAALHEAVRRCRNGHDTIVNLDKGELFIPSNLFLAKHSTR